MFLIVNVRFSGIPGLQVDSSGVDMEAASVEELLSKISSEYNKITLEQLKNSIIFVNGKNIVNLNVFKTTLEDGDEVKIFSPAIGG